MSTLAMKYKSNDMNIGLLISCVNGPIQPNIIKIKVYKSNGKKNGNGNGYESYLSKKFCIDSRLISFQTIQTMIIQAFDVKSDFHIYAIDRCSIGKIEQITPIQSDFDLEKEINRVKNGSYLRLRFDLMTHDDDLEEWDFVPMNESCSDICLFHIDDQSVVATMKPKPKKKSSVLNKAISWMYGRNERTSSKPIGENEFKTFFDAEGRLIHAYELRKAVYECGIVPACRKHVWKHLLNIFPPKLTHRGRVEYLRNISVQYDKLKGKWKDEQHKDSIHSIMRNIYIDVVRTDRTFSFYGNIGDENENLKALYDILITYCASHPGVPYSQGMNEYASTLLYVMGEEYLAYICFCSVMKRIRANFSTDGVAMATKFRNLKILLKAIDPVYANYLESCGAVHLYFTYRWLLLECKREFPFTQSLRIVETIWATLPIENEPPEMSEMALLPSTSLEHVFDEKSWNAIHSLRKRRVNSCPQLSVIPETYMPKVKHSYSVTSDYYQTSISSIVTQEEIVDQSKSKTCSVNSHSSSSSSSSSVTSKENSFENSLLFIRENENDPTLPSNSQSQYHQTISNNFKMINWVENLLRNDPLSLDDNNIFLLFVCLSLLLKHRNHLLKQKNFDEQDITMHFDRYRRRHNVEKILICAKTLYEQYIEWTSRQRIFNDLSSFSAS